MNAYTYDFEVQTMSTALMNAFSDIIIKRFDVNKNFRDRIKTRIVYAPKQRVLNDLLNKDQNLQLPVISVNIGSIVRDDNRVFNKILGTYHTPVNSTSSVHERGVLPIDVSYNISILTRFQQDMDQILSHFLPYINPYFIISWRTPNRPDHEIRSKVMWDGSVNIQYPTETNASQIARVQADLTFVFKGWLFQTSDNIENIYSFDSSIIASENVSFDTLLNTDVAALTSIENIAITRIKYNAGVPKPKFVDPIFTTLSAAEQITVWGVGFDAVKNIYLSGAPVHSVSQQYDVFNSNVELSGTNPSFFGVKLLSSTWSVDKEENSVTFNAPIMNQPGRVEVIIEGPKGYGRLTKNVPKISLTQELPYLSGFQVF